MGVRGRRFAKRGFFLPYLTALFTGLAVNSAFAEGPFHLLVVDKSQNKIHLGNYLGDHIELEKSFHVTLGRRKGDKEIEKDLKTPEGVYLFTSKLMSPQLKKKFGKMAFMVNYPNPIDQIAGKTGYHIMLHSTDDPPRLERDLDSEGCVVVNDDQIEELSKSIQLGLTPIIIYPELRPEYLKVDANPSVQSAFSRWLKAWNAKDIETYIGSYSEQFHFGGMDLKRYREYKRALNQRYAEISVQADHLRYFYHPKYDVVQFTQHYESRLKSGSKGFKSSGTKWLYFMKEGDQYKIANESYSSLREP